MEKEVMGLDEIKSVMDRMRRLQKNCIGVMANEIRKNDIDLSPDQSRLLFMIGLDKVVQQKEIAKKLKVTPATLSVRVQRLEKAGYLRREVDPNDKRNYILAVQPKGKELVKQSIAIMEKVGKQLFEGFSKEEIETMNSFLDRMKNNVIKIKEDQ